ncbi:hypothetical protein [Neobacillus mesonae]|uniref:Uncharacterized protein n=1 Tax=Neobacillus mesonae TaxID=1193713 RepID=A0A3Q9QXZ3_9BACI|nr:hypothetical protein [Neobacillus mesonae]AZU64022.1 hypothetical protein CHR53_23720 [Neobacillus mesonae]
MSLRGIRIIQRIVGVLFLAGGVYLIFVTQEFFGTILIILAFLIFPTIEKKNNSDNPEHAYQQERYNEFANDNDHSFGGGGSDGGTDSDGSGD